MSGWGRGINPQHGTGRGHRQNYPTQQPQGHCAQGQQGFGGGRGFSTGLGRGYGGYGPANLQPGYYDQHQQFYYGGGSHQHDGNHRAGTGRGFVTGMGRGSYSAPAMPVASSSQMQGNQGRAARGRARHKQPRSAVDIPEAFPSSSAFPASPQAGVNTGLGRGLSPHQDCNRPQATGSQGPVNPTRSGESKVGMGRGFSQGIYSDRPQGRGAQRHSNPVAVGTSSEDSQFSAGGGFSPSLDSVTPQATGRQNPGNAGASTSMGGSRSDVKSKTQNAPQTRHLQQCLDRVNFSSDSDLGKVIACLQSLENLWFNTDRAALPEKEKHSQSAEILDKCFKDAENPWAAALYLTRTAKDYMTAKPSCLAYFCMRIFAKWCREDPQREEQGQQLLTAELKMAAFKAATGKHTPIFDATASAFQLDGSDKEQFVESIRQFVVNDRLKDACVVVSRLGLQSHFTKEEVLVPLFLQDKVNLVESYLAGCVELQREFLSLLDQLCNRHVDINQFVDAAKVKGVKRDKLIPKTISKLAARLLKLYGIPADACPNITNNRSLGGIRYLMYKRYTEQGMGHGPFRERIEESVATNEFLQEQLVQLLACSNHNEEALYWADRFATPEDKLPTAVLELREERERSEQPGSKDYVPVTMVDEEDWDADGNTMSMSEMMGFYYPLALHENQISLVESVEQLEEFYAKIGQPGTVIGFDSEWRPGFIGKQERIALLQVATHDHAFLIDANKLQHILDASGLQKLASAIFCDENNLTLGYGLATDLRMLVRSFPAMRDVMHKMKRVVDIETLAKTVFKVPEYSLDMDVMDEHGEIMDDGQSGGARRKGRDDDDADGAENSAGSVGLSQLVKQCLGKPLCKSEQMSDWERRPLRPAQITYAALDAFVLLELYNHLCKTAQENKMDVDLEPKVSLKWLSPSKNERRRAKASKKAQKVPGRKPLPKPRNYPPMSVREFRVIVDSSLVGLGYQLRICGADVKLLEDHAPHSEMVQIALKEERIALSAGMPFDSIRASLGEHGCYQVVSQGLKEQVLEVLTAFNVHVAQGDIFSRCQTCNSDRYIWLSGERMLQLHKKRQLTTDKDTPSATPEDSEHSLSSFFAEKGVSYETVSLTASGAGLKVDTIPVPILEKVEEFYVCCTCGKVFWQGSHFERVCDQFDYILTARAPPQPDDSGAKVGQEKNGGAMQPQSDAAAKSSETPKPDGQETYVAARETTAEPGQATLTGATGEATLSGTTGEATITGATGEATVIGATGETTLTAATGETTLARQGREMQGAVSVDEIDPSQLVIRDKYYEDDYDSDDPYDGFMF